MRYLLAFLCLAVLLTGPLAAPMLTAAPVDHPDMILVADEGDGMLDGIDWDDWLLLEGIDWDDWLLLDGIDWDDWLLSLGIDPATWPDMLDGIDWDDWLLGASAPREG